MTAQTRDFRYERKFLVDQLDVHRVRALVKLHPSMFYEPYPPRYVNNLYLDTELLDNYQDNMSGVGERRKVRIRWYGELFGPVEKPVLEFKFKSGLVGTKVGYPFTPFVLDERFGHRYYLDTLRVANLPAHVEQYLRELHVVLCNRYYRWYYATRDGRFRVTVDAEMAFYQVRRTTNHFRHRHMDYRHVVVELKYGKSMDVEAERVSRVFPFSVTKNSKYVIGIEQVYL
ncbi:MAG: VTC domain-containing protein [Anaerolineae bacterium]|nr:VTC domain-containing protein [Anaerolineae bacterium]